MKNIIFMDGSHFLMYVLLKSVFFFTTVTNFAIMRIKLFPVENESE